MASHFKFTLIYAGIALVVTQFPAFAETNFVMNGGFEITNSLSGNTTGLGHIDKGITLPSWTKTCLLQCGGIQNQATSYGFAFVVDDKIATRPGGGVTAFINSGTENLYFWGPNNTSSYSNNNFSGSPSGGKFVAIDGDFGRSKLSQSVSGLDTTKQYTLSFEYAGSQQGIDTTRFTGDTTQKWLVDGITSSQITVGDWINPSKGFTPWKTYSTTFTPLAPTINLAFTPFGNVVGGGEPTGFNSLPPFLLLDNVKILEGNVTPPPPPGPPGSPVPAPLPVLGAGMAFSFARRLRQRLKAA